MIIMNSIKLNEIDLGKTPVKKVFWTYAIPSILAMIAQSTAGLIDSIFIGRFVGPLGLSAITLVMPISMILIGTAAMVAIGGTTLAGIELGKNNKITSNNYFNTTIFLLSITAILVTLTILIFADKAADVINATGITKTYILEYSKTIGLFFVFFMLNFAFSFFLKLDGKPIAVVAITLSGTIINIVLDYLLISKLNMAMKGAALATGLSQLIPWILFMITIHRKSIWQFRIPVLRSKEIWRMVFNGSSEFLSTISVSISGMVFNLIIINRIGISGISGYAVALQIAYLATSFNYGFAESVQSGISYNFGAGNLKRVREFLKMSVSSNLATGILLFAFSFFFGKHIAGVFVSNTATIALAADILKFYSFAFIFMGVNITVGTYYTAVDDPILSGFIMLFRSLISLIIGLLLLPLIFGVSGIWASVIFAEFTTLLVSMVLMKKKPYGSSKLHL
jgi:putative MATE family efflux protein